MRRLLLVVVVFAVSSALAADPTITSVSPADGPVSGGTVVQIRGTGFLRECNPCSPSFPGSQVLFGGVYAVATVIDTTLIEATAPPHLPGAVPVTVDNSFSGIGKATLADAFTYTGDPETALDGFLFPLFSLPIYGAFGSRFDTSAFMMARSPGGDYVPVYGADQAKQECGLDRRTNPVLLSPGHITALWTYCSTWTGRILWIAKENRVVAANLRVADVSRAAGSHGVEIPVVRLEDFRDDAIVLIGVPNDPRFRKTLRIYAAGGEATVSVRTSLYRLPQQVALTPGRDLFEPSYAVFTDFPAPGQLPLNVTSYEVYIQSMAGSNGAPIPNPPRIWAFISVTNNDTQEITTITPQP